ncbi:MAG: Uma2 family endonuclease [Pleurocapsa sp. SU_196_0]|nr:Uma2 family endonuclease [Pleurocapsa sp. SU_196_0]
MVTDARITPEQYLELERKSEVRHEFSNGVMQAMAGDKKRNNRVVGKLYRLLIERAEAKGCDVFFTVVKMRIPNGKYRYPDVVVTCEDDADEYLIEAPCAVFEVLSESTEDVDTNEKLEEYLKIPSVQRYVLLRQDRALAMVYAREKDGWRFSLLEDTGAFDVPCIGATLKLEEIYAGIIQTTA